MNWTTAFQLLIAGLTVAAGMYATRAARRGKIAELRQQAVAAAAAQETAERTQAFAELDRSLEAARRDLDYYEKQLKAARDEARTALTEKDRLQQEWIERNKRLLARCQALAHQIETIINGPLQLPPAQRLRLEAAVQEVATHVRDDHEHFDD